MKVVVKKLPSKQESGEGERKLLLELRVVAFLEKHGRCLAKPKGLDSQQGHRDENIGGMMFKKSQLWPREGQPDLGRSRFLDPSHYFSNLTCHLKDMVDLQSWVYNRMCLNKHAKYPRCLTRSSGGNMGSWVGSKGWNSSFANSFMQIFEGERSRRLCQLSSTGKNTGILDRIRQDARVSFSPSRELNHSLKGECDCQGETN